MYALRGRLSVNFLPMFDHSVFDCMVHRAMGSRRASWRSGLSISAALVSIAVFFVPVRGFSYRYASFATAHPKAAVHFCVTYLDALPISNNHTGTAAPQEDSELMGVQLPYDGGYSDIYFPRASKDNGQPGAVSVEEVSTAGNMACVYSLGAQVHFLWVLGSSRIIWSVCILCLRTPGTASSTGIWPSRKWYQHVFQQSCNSHIMITCVPACQCG